MIFRYYFSCRAAFDADKLDWFSLIDICLMLFDAIDAFIFSSSIAAFALPYAMPFSAHASIAVDDFIIDSSLLLIIFAKIIFFFAMLMFILRRYFLLHARFSLLSFYVFSADADDWCHFPSFEKIITALFAPQACQQHYHIEHNGTTYAMPGCRALDMLIACLCHYAPRLMLMRYARRPPRVLLCCVYDDLRCRRIWLRFLRHCRLIDAAYDCYVIDVFALIYAWCCRLFHFDVYFLRFHFADFRFLLIIFAIFIFFFRFAWYFWCLRCHFLRFRYIFSFSRYFLAMLSPFSMLTGFSRHAWCCHWFIYHYWCLYYFSLRWCFLFHYFIILPWCCRFRHFWLPPLFAYCLLLRYYADVADAAAMIHTLRRAMRCAFTLSFTRLRYYTLWYSALCRYAHAITPAALPPLDDFFHASIRFLFMASRSIDWFASSTFRCRRFRHTLFMIFTLIFSIAPLMLPLFFISFSFFHADAAFWLLLFLIIFSRFDFSLSLMVAPSILRASWYADAYACQRASLSSFSASIWGLQQALAAASAFDFGAISFCLLATLSSWYSAASCFDDIFHAVTSLRPLWCLMMMLMLRALPRLWCRAFYFALRALFVFAVDVSLLLLRYAFHASSAAAAFCHTPKMLAAMLYARYARHAAAMLMFSLSMLLARHAMPPCWFLSHAFCLCHFWLPMIFIDCYFHAMLPMLPICWCWLFRWFSLLPWCHAWFSCLFWCRFRCFLFATFIFSPFHFLADFHFSAFRCFFFFYYFFWLRSIDFLAIFSIFASFASSILLYTTYAHAWWCFRFSARFSCFHYADYLRWLRAALLLSWLMIFWLAPSSLMPWCHIAIRFRFHSHFAFAAFFDADWYHYYVSVLLPLYVFRFSLLLAMLIAAFFAAFYFRDD